MEKNNFGEIIPDFKNILSGIESINLKNLKFYTFFDIFKEYGKENGNQEYSKINENILKMKHDLGISESEEISGIYILYDKDNTPQYVGESATIIRRIRQHFYGKSISESSLVYLMALKEYHKVHGVGYETTGKLRRNFEFDKYGRKKFQKEMRDNWKIKVVLEKDPYKYHLMEFYFASILKTKWNCFSVH